MNTFFGRFSKGRISALACLLFTFVPVGANAGSARADAARLLGPPPDAQPPVVSASFYLTDLSRVEGEHELCVFEGKLTLTWQDSRQSFDPEETGLSEMIYQGNYQFSEVYNGWWPQIALRNESGELSREGNILHIAPNGAMAYTEELEVSAKSPMQMGGFPFDRQTCTASIEVLGFDSRRVVLRADDESGGRDLAVHRVADWRLIGLSQTVSEVDSRNAEGSSASSSVFHVNIQVERDPGFALRVIVLPLVMLVMLSWSVFWMNRDSLGDRLDVSFVVILTVVAFQILVSEQMPRIPYFTLMSAFLYINYMMLVASVVINISVDRLARRGQTERSHSVDFRCRWLFPVIYITLLMFAGVLYL